jgi:hypothetical protein
MNEVLKSAEALFWPYGVIAIMALTVAWFVTLGGGFLFRHEAQKLRYRVLETLENSDGLMLFEISMMVRRDGQDLSDVLAALESLVSEGVVYKVRTISEFAQHSIRFRYFLVEVK